jgi:hypothetical protein
MNKKISTGVGIAIIAILSAVVGLSVWWNLVNQEKAANQNFYVKNGSESRLAEWKIYKNSDFKFSFKYPVFYKVSAGNGYPGYKDENAMIVSFSATQKGGGSGVYYGMGGVWVFRESESKSALASADKELDNYRKEKTNSISDTTIGDVKAKKIIDSDGEDNYIVVNRNIFYHIGIPGKEGGETKRKIIDSFRFLP